MSNPYSDDDRLQQIDNLLRHPVSRFWMSWPTRSHSRTRPL